MAQQDQAWIAPWVAQKVTKPDNFVSAQAVGDHHVQVVRKEYPGHVLVGTIAVERVDAQVVKPLLAEMPPLDFIVNVPRESYVTGDAIRLATARSVPIGGLGDLMRAVRAVDVSAYKSQEVTFLERGLHQHSRVADFERVHDRLYSISRDGLPSVTVVFLNAYEMTADHLRTARARYGQFQMVVMTNPNGRPTSKATDVAGRLGVTIYEWGAFLGALNRP